MFAQIQTIIRTTANMGGTIKRVATSIFPINVIRGRSLRCWVLSIRLLNSISSPGINVNTDKRLNRIALINTVARSSPMPKCINASAARPDMVVKEEEDISGIALASAAIQASLAGMVSCSSLKRWQRIMA